MADLSGSAVRGGDRTWRYGLMSRIALAVLVAIIFGIAAGTCGLAVFAASSDAIAAWILAFTALASTAFGVFMTFGLIAFERTRISLTTGADGTSLDATVSAGHNRLLVPRFRTVRLRAGEIRSVERRREIVRLLGFSTIEDALSVVTAGGERIGLFSSSEMAAIHLPVDEVAAAIAAAAGIGVTDGGTVLTTTDDLYGAASSTWTERPLDAVSARKARAAALRTFQIIFGLMTLTFVLRACGA
jgi:hypothetical protein